MEDFEKGWAEALGQEYETIAHQELMAREELRLYRHRLYLAEEELFALYLEYEENELEIDQLDQLMIGAMEKSRLRQILYAERKANLNTFKAIYREKVHWKVTSNRTKKVFNNRQRNKEIIEQVSKVLLVVQTIVSIVLCFSSHLFSISNFLSSSLSSLSMFLL